VAMGRFAQPPAAATAVRGVRLPLDGGVRLSGLARTGHVRLCQGIYMPTCIYIYIHMYMYVYVCVYIYIEREREEYACPASPVPGTLGYAKLCIYTYIYTYV